MATALSGAEAGLVGYWRFNEGSGDAVSDIVGGHIGTVVNGAVWTSGGAPVN
jgi:hypothetical protein